MAGFVTRGQSAAVRQVSAMIAAGLPHALLLVGPRSVGKTTLALDIAAAQLCLAPQPTDRPCRVCRGCRLVDSGNHPDILWLQPQGLANQIIIGDPHNPEPGSVRYVLPRLALLASEGGDRVVIAESAHRMNEDAQNALLKTLEEPPSEVTLILCAEDEDRLLPTIHSRVARVRLGTLAARDIEDLLAARGEADGPTANRVARLAGGRPGLAIAYARSPDAAAIRGELARSLLDLADASRAIRLARIRELLARAADLLTALTPAQGMDAAVPARGGKRRSRMDGPPPAPTDIDSAPEPGLDAEAEAPAAGGKASPAERRRAAGTLLEVWRETGRDLALVELGELTGLQDPDLLEELGSLAARLPPGSAGRFLVRLARAGQLLDANANPELAADVLALAWPRATRAA